MSESLQTPENPQSPEVQPRQPETPETAQTPQPAPKPRKPEPFTSNAIRMTGKELIGMAIGFVVIVFYLLPWVWRSAETIKTDGEFRIAYDYRDDYWIWEAWAGKAAADYPVLFLGDSVVWGMYVDGQNTLPAIINRKRGKKIVANLAIDGLHSVAMKRLVEVYGNGIRGKKVFLHYNPLWMNNAKYDLSGTEEMTPHHPRLLPQFYPWIPCYRASLNERMGVVLEQHVPFFLLLNHVRLTGFENEDFKQWIVDNPSTNPADQVSFVIDAAEKEKTNVDLTWDQRGISEQDWKWLTLEQSTQWRHFTGLVRELLAADNKVCVMVGPINPHMLSVASRAQYHQRQQEIKAELDKLGCECILVPDLPSDVYADASHPLKRGYELIADELLKTDLLKSVD